MTWCAPGNLEALADIAAYDRLVTRGVEDYGTLRNLARKLPGFGRSFEVDHLLEQRFWRNNPALTVGARREGRSRAVRPPPAA
jgi:hypothetical protein